MRLLFSSAALALASVSQLASQPAAAQFSVNISVNFAPPTLPIYDQPPIPAPDYIWVPGYWAWDDFVQDYYWVLGTWVMAPRPGLLWTPPWWGWQGGAYLFHPGYWGPHVGFYGGVVYGFGYSGTGYEGGYWNGGHVFYNRSVTNISNVNVTNVYNKTVVINHITNVSYNGGPNGVQARANPAEQAAMHEQHVAPPQAQIQHVQAARENKQLFASANHGRPPIAAVPKAAQLSGPGVVATRQAAPYHPPAVPAGHQGASRPGAAPPAPGRQPPSPNGHPDTVGASPPQSAEPGAARPNRPSSPGDGPLRDAAAPLRDDSMTAMRPESGAVRPSPQPHAHSTRTSAPPPPRPHPQAVPKALPARPHAAPPPRPRPPAPKAPPQHKEEKR